MRRITALVSLAVTWNLCVAQDLIITNARIIDGAGTIIDSGSVVVEDGRIASVSENTSYSEESTVIDAHGMTVIPGLIDTHVHLLVFSRAASQEELDAWIETSLPGVLEEMVAAGVTTVLNAGDYANAILRLKERLNGGELEGPRMMVVGPAFTAPNTLCRGNPFCRESFAAEVDDPELARARVRALIDAGVDMIKAIYHQRNSRTSMDAAVLAAMVSEAKELGVPVIVHDQRFQGMIQAVGQGVNHFVHTPFLDAVNPSEAERLFVGSGVQVSTTVAVFDYAMTDDEGVERDVFGFPMTSLVGARESALANAVVLRDAGVSLAFGTDTPPLRTYDEAILGELQTLNEVFPADEILEMITRRAAAYLGVEGELGTLEPGKIADIVIVDGDPLSDISELRNVEVVVQGGRVIVDNR